ncbi:MAG: hypothetical protein HYX92_00590 [Chloroflexi bacterium]|nr:hypothetical protein [Chloroflexota bacterium]
MSTGKLILVGLAQALGTVVYCVLVAFLVMNSRAWFGRPNVFFAFATFLLLFIFSACITGGLVLGYPGYLALRQRMREGAVLLIATVAWLIVFFALFLPALLFFRP